MAGSPMSLTGCWGGDSAAGMAGLTALDILVLLALAAGLVTGALRGFVQEILSLFALIAALFVLRIVHAPLSAWLAGIVGTESGAAVLAFAIILVIVWGGGKLAARRVGASARRSLIGPVDRVLGAGFGVVKALLIAALGFLLFTLVYDVAFGADSDRPAWIAQSRTYPLLRATSAALSEIAAERLKRDDAGDASDTRAEAKAR